MVKQYFIPFFLLLMFIETGNGFFISFYVYLFQVALQIELLLLSPEQFLFKKLLQVEGYNSERALHKTKRESTYVGTNEIENQNQSVGPKGISELVGKYIERLKLISKESFLSQNNSGEDETKSLRTGTDSYGINFTRCPLSW